MTERRPARPAETTTPAPTARPTARLRLGFAGPDGCAEPHLSVDGMTPAGPNLSHWPGNRTPPLWKADLSTGIALRFARAGPAERAAFLDDVELVLNDHYDTDGFGALLAVLRPEVAFAHEELLLAAATTGDFGTWQTWRGFAIDRAVARLAAPESPVAATFAGIADPAAKSLARYRWLCEHAEELLRAPEHFAPVYAAEMAQVQQQLDAGLRGAVQRRQLPELGLAVLTSDGPRHRMVLNTLAGAFRVLHVANGRDGPRYRYHDRTETWFELATLAPLPRRDLRPLAARLGALEPPHGSMQWCADPPDEPIPELWFGVAGTQEYGQVTRQLAPSRLGAERVADELRAFFAPAGAP
ncbi:MAG: hypothetical protein FJ265_08655 [Planctomycetes bacterium]|nr:hypothetical protein [Planctomycetota bacterium]